MIYLFVGEKPSNRAFKNGWSWVDGRLAAKQLFDGLKANGIDPMKHRFMNLWTYEGELNELGGNYIGGGYVIVGMGKKVQHQLDEMGINHIKIIHPAARGKIRKKSRYAEHLKKVLK